MLQVFHRSLSHGRGPAFPGCTCRVKGVHSALAPSGHARTLPRCHPQARLMEISAPRSKQSQLFIAAAPGQRRRRGRGSFSAAAAGKRSRVTPPVPGPCPPPAAAGLLLLPPAPNSAWQSSEPRGEEEHPRQVPLVEERRVQRHSLLRIAVTPGDVAPQIVTGTNQITAAELKGICLLKIA